MSDQRPDDDDVEVIETFATGEKFSESSGQVLHERGIPLALRVRSGFFEENGLNLEGAQVDWADIEYIALGIIHHSLGSMDPPKGMMRQVVGKIMGKNDRAEAKAPRYQESVFLDLYSSKHDAPFRFEAAAINYRSFLGKDALYISQHNFYRLLVRIARASTAARVNDNAYYYIIRRRDQVKTYAAIYDYELESQNDLGRLEFLRTTTELDLSRDSYTSEEDELDNVE
ncbi:hypothetical protein JST97_05360 [bacterium]|nr:hypothetical protein [bacterium]